MMTYTKGPGAGGLAPMGGATPEPQTNPPQGGSNASAGQSATGGLLKQDAGEPKGLLDEAKAQAGALAEDARSSVESAATQGKEKIADQLEDAAQAIHKSGEQLEGQQDWLAALVERGADELSGLASTLRENDIEGLMGGLEGLARRQPAVFVGAAIAAGFAMSRLGKVAASGLSQADLPKVPEVHLGSQA